MNAIINWYMDMHTIATNWFMESPTAYYLLMTSGIAIGVVIRDAVEIAENLYYKFKEIDNE